MKPTLSYALKRTFNILIFISLTGCSTSPEYAMDVNPTIMDVNPIKEHIDTPILGSKNISELGNTLVTKGIKYQYDALKLKSPITFGGTGGGLISTWFSIQPQVLIAKYHDNENIWYDGNTIMVGASQNSQKTKKWTSGGGLITRKNDPKKLIGAWYSDFASTRPVDKVFELTPQNEKPLDIYPKIDYKFIKVNDHKSPSFEQQLIYNGHIGDQVKFLYRELSSNMMRAPFIQEIQYDLKESNTIGFKGVRIEIIKATNRQIEYIVHRSFPDYE